MDTSSPSLVDVTGQHVIRHVSHAWASSISGVLYGAFSVIVPDAVISYGLKIALALPLGLMTGLGTALASWLLRKVAARAGKSKVA